MNILEQYKQQYKQQLHEGVNDPAIFKVVFLAGGPGSGKSFIVGKTALSALGYTTINSDHPFEVLMKKLNLDFKMPESEKEVRDAARDRAKATAKTKLDLALNGRLGIVIDGTGQDFEKIQKMRIKMAALGYDAAMVFVNTNIQTALARNAARARSVPEDIAKQIWQGVQDNIGKFKQFFGDRFHIIDNSEGADYDKQVQYTYKKIMQWTKEPPKNALAKQWIAQQRGIKESTETLVEQTYFATMADAVQFARMAAEKKGYEIDADDWFEKINTGPKKPSVGKTNSYNIKLKKNGKETKRGLAIQVYGMDSGKYELNSYVS